MQYIVQMYGDEVCRYDWHVDGIFDFCRFYYVKGGEASYSGPDGAYPLNCGSLYVFPCDAQYKITHNPDHPFQVLWFHVSIFTYRAAEPVEMKIEPDSLAYHLLQSLAFGMNISTPIVEKLFGILFDVIGSSLNYGAANAEIVKVFNCINSNPGIAYTIRQLAGMLGYSEKYFIRFFTKHAGMQPHKYIVNVRMSNAVKYLIEGKSIKETASLLGYGSASNFSRDFKLHYRLSPKDYSAAYSYRP